MRDVRGVPVVRKLVIVKPNASARCHQYAKRDKKKKENKSLENQHEIVVACSKCGYQTFLIFF